MIYYQFYASDKVLVLPVLSFSIFTTSADVVGDLNDGSSSSSRANPPNSPSSACIASVI